MHLESWIIETTGLETTLESNGFCVIRIECCIVVLILVNSYMHAQGSKETTDQTQDVLLLGS